MKKIYLFLPLWILIASPGFVQNFTFETNNQFNIHKQAEDSPAKPRKDHRGSGRRNNNIVRNS
ncbi:hypothetical protein IQ247_31345 [Plectonema cf. radiosum LEGE 06105]|uniref:Uncharacterized protein n=1 Tax=Plectonema cf. radiosum LEGE 06105 TaxID=945769 RepID=A0A8J7F7T6_9CYAN|nr:hypothetical protein [Plectonema radiosum]MBE9217095.1 hypothetical protein [Plectonema cf. radiosum LEGE 06105]